MKSILFMLLTALLILSIFATGCVSYERYLAPIDGIDIWADNSSPPQYFLYVVSGEPNTCAHFDSYNMTRASNTTIIVDIFNLHSIGEPCGEMYSYVEHTIPLGSDFVSGGNYTVEVNDVTVTFVAGGMIYPALILSIDVWPGGSSPTQYFLGILSVQPSSCNHFDSYNVTRAGNTIQVGFFNRRYCTDCPDDWYWDEDECVYVQHTIPLGSDFVPGGNYTVKVNDVTETFVA
jgi:hypothetical protein